MASSLGRGMSNYIPVVNATAFYKIPFFLREWAPLEAAAGTQRSSTGKMKSGLETMFKTYAEYRVRAHII